MDAAVSLHHGALPAASSLPPPPHHHRALHLRHPPPSSTSSISTRLAVTAARPKGRALPRSSASPSAARAPATPVIPTQSTRAATGYAAALADASLRAGTLVRASRHARALLKPQPPPRGWPRLEPDPRVGALVRMLAGKGKAAMVAEVMAEFTAICDHLLHSSAHPHTSSC